MASNVLGKQDWGWDERDILEINLQYTGRACVNCTGSRSQPVTGNTRGQCRTAPRQHHARRGADTHHSATDRRSAPRIRYTWQISGRWKQGDRNSMLNIRTLHIKKGPLQSLVLAQRWAPEHKECSTQVKSVKTVFSPDQWLFFI